MYAIIWLILIAIISIATVWTDRNLDFIFSYIKWTDVDIPMWLSFITTILLNWIIIIFNVITELFKFIL